MHKQNEEKNKPFLEKLKVKEIVERKHINPLIAINE